MTEDNDNNKGYWCPTEGKLLSEPCAHWHGTRPAEPVNGLVNYVNYANVEENKYMVTNFEEELKKWLENNPDCPEDIREWITRKGGVGKPSVSDKDKQNFMRSHAFVKEEIEEMAKPLEITKVDSLAEAAEITTRDMNKGNEPS